MQQEENENILNKVPYFLLHLMIFINVHIVTYMSKTIPLFSAQLRLEEERCEEAEARVRELEKQVNDFFKHVVRCGVCISVLLPFFLWSFLTEY